MNGESAYSMGANAPQRRSSAPTVEYAVSKYDGKPIGVYPTKKKAYQEAFKWLSFKNAKEIRVTWVEKRYVRETILRLEKGELKEEDVR